MAKRDPPATARIFDAFREVFGLPATLTVTARGEINKAIENLSGAYPGLKTLKDHPDHNLVGSVAAEVLRRGKEYKQQYPDRKYHSVSGLVKRWPYYEHVRTPEQILDCKFQDWWRDKLFVPGIADLEHSEARRLFLKVVGNAEWSLWSEGMRQQAKKWCAVDDVIGDVMGRPHVKAVLAELEAEQGATA